MRGRQERHPRWMTHRMTRRLKKNRHPNSGEWPGQRADVNSSIVHRPGHTNKANGSSCAAQALAQAQVNNRFGHT